MELDLDNTPDIDEIHSGIVDVENVEHESIEGSSISQHLIKETSLIEAPSASKSSNKEQTVPKKPKLVRLPLGRVKNIMKMDPDCNLVSPDAVFLVTKATEMFLEYIAKASVKSTHSAKRKTVLKRDMEAAIDSIDHLCFLEGALE